MIKEKVDTVFQRLEAEELTASGLQRESGWLMYFPSGKAAARSTLQAEAQPLIALGADAVPYLLTRVTDKNQPLRYVALYALEQITGQKPYVPYFDQGDKGAHTAEAVEIWRKWYEENKKGDRQKNEANR